MPLRLEIGPKDIEKEQCVLVRRDTREKLFVRWDELETAVPSALAALGQSLFDRAAENRARRTWSAATMEEVLSHAEENGYIQTMWCGERACEEAMKEKAGLTSRCIPFVQEHLGDVCPVCGKPAKQMIVWGRAY